MPKMPMSFPTSTERGRVMGEHPLASPTGAELADVTRRLSDLQKRSFSDKAEAAADRIKSILENEPDKIRRSVLERLTKKFKTDSIIPRSPREKRAMLDAGELMEWQEAGLRFEKPSGSVLHHLFDAFSRGEVRFLLPEMGGKIYDSTIDPQIESSGVQSFVIQHNWSEAFKNATDFGEGHYKIPYPSCCFEFRLSGKQVIALVQDDVPERDFQRTMMIFVRASSGWVLPQFAYATSQDHEWRPTTKMSASRAPFTDHFHPLMKVIAAQVRAICISLEAEVSVTEVVRASHRLNQSRERNGRHPVADYHVVHLAHRKRYLPVPAEMRSTDGRNSPRLHFRRGHDRHYQNYKIWIKWQLVGDPDLGFVDKEYRL